MKRVLITGGSGFVGTKLLAMLGSRYETVGTYYWHPVSGLLPLDVTNESEVTGLFQKVSPDIVIHTVALSDPDYCEEHPQETEVVNLLGTKYIVDASREVGAKLIHISTSAVFDGRNAPYRENDPAFPINKYGETKARAEGVVRTLEDFVILRFDFLYGYNGEGRPNGLLGKIISGVRIDANPVQRRKPLLVDDVGRTIIRLLEEGERGIFHLAGPDNITKYELCKRLEGISGVYGNINPIEAGAQIAKRAEDTSLLTERLDALGVKFTPIEEALSLIKEQLSRQGKEGQHLSIERF